MREVKEHFTLEDVKDLPSFLQEQILGKCHNKTKSKINLIKDRLAKGYKQTEIAKELNMSRQAVNQLINFYIKEQD